jgi:hypothetical protein
MDRPAKRGAFPHLLLHYSRVVGFLCFVPTTLPGTLQLPPSAPVAVWHYCSCRTRHLQSMPHVLYLQGVQVADLFGAQTCAVRCTGQWELLCMDVRRIILSMLNLRELARAAPTCPEFRLACVAQMAIERANIIAAGRRTLGETTFSNLVSALQRAMCNQDPCPGLAPKPPFCGGVGHIGILTADPEPVITTEAEAHRRGFSKAVCVYLRKGPFLRRLTAEVRLGGCNRDSLPVGYWDRIVVGGHGSSNGSQVELAGRMPKEHAVAGLGILLAVCTEVPKAMLPCLQNPVTIHLTFMGFPDHVEGWESLSVLLGPLASLANRYSLRPFRDGQTSTPCEGKPGIGLYGVVGDFTVIYC